MSFFIYIFIFILGISMGSFLNVVICRLGTKRPIFSGHSHCPRCGHILGWKDLIPIFSFLFLRGRCRYCGKKISWQYPLVELATGLLFVLILRATTRVAPTTFLVTGYRLLVTCFLIIIFVYDLKHYLIPDKIVYSAILVSLIYRFFRSYFILHTSYFILSAIYSAFGAAAFFLAIYLISKGRWMGMGDVKLSFLIGLFLGFPKTLIALFLAFFLGAATGLILIALNKKSWSSKVPFAPFLITGTFIALFWSEIFLEAYYRLMVY